MSNVFADGAELVNKDDLILNTNLLAGIKPQNNSYDTSSQNALVWFPNPARLSFFPIPVENGEQILVKLTKISNTQEAYWGYFFTTVNKDDIPNTMVSSALNWIYGTSTKLVVPQNAKYFGVCLGSNKPFTERTMSQFAQLEVIKQTNVVDYIKTNFDALKSKIEGE